MSTLSLSPRWIGHLTSILAENKKATIYSLATVSTDSEGLPIPRTRHIVHRDILSAHPARPLLVATTDIRTPKIHQIRSHPSAKGPTAEIAWWIQEASVQFRIGARVHILPSTSHKDHSQFPLSLLSSSGGGDSGPDAPETAQDWEKLRMKTFNKLPDFLRASFARPVPGSVLINSSDAEKWPKELPEAGKEQTDEERKQMKEALANFAVLLLEPLQAEFLELGVVPNRRTQWSFDGQEWDETAVVP